MQKIFIWHVRFFLNSLAIELILLYYNILCVMQVQVCAIWMEIKITINAGAHRFNKSFAFSEKLFSISFIFSTSLLSQNSANFRFQMRIRRNNIIWESNRTGPNHICGIYSGPRRTGANDTCQRMHQTVIIIFLTWLISYNWRKSETKRPFPL